MTEWLAEVTAEYWRESAVAPACDSEQGRLVTSAEPDPQAVAELGAAMGFHMQVSECSSEEFEAGLDAISRGSGPAGADALFLELEGSDGGGLDELPEHDLLLLANQAPVIRLVNRLLAEAVELGASDVHLETSQGRLLVRYRIDGVLQAHSSPPAHLRAAIVSRIKVMAALDIAERRRSQDGRIRLRHGNHEIDVRVSTLPALHGESVVLRLLTSHGQRFSLSELGMSESMLERLTSFASRPSGVLLATGPTGSGKTTTLYALLEEILSGGEKVVALEDPIEFDLPGVTQVPVRQGMVDFAGGLRASLRQDPDILLVGEMRDSETAEVCAQAALTGHLVLSTLHTNDAPAALIRLVDLGVPAYLVASTVNLVLAQRLVRRVCGVCAGSREPTDSELKEMERFAIASIALVEPRGCQECRHSGYRGRLGLFELLEIDSRVQEAILERPSAPALRDFVRQLGMQTMRENGWQRVAEGLTTAEELLRVTV